MKEDMGKIQKDNKSEKITVRTPRFRQEIRGVFCIVSREVTSGI